MTWESKKVAVAVLCAVVSLGHLWLAMTVVRSLFGDGGEER